MDWGTEMSLEVTDQPNQGGNKYPIKNHNNYISTLKGTCTPSAL